MRVLEKCNSHYSALSIILAFLICFSISPLVMARGGGGGSVGVGSAGTLMAGSVGGAQYMPTMTGQSSAYMAQYGNTGGYMTQTSAMMPANLMGYGYNNQYNAQRAGVINQYQMQNLINQNTTGAPAYMGMASSYMNQYGYGNQGSGLMNQYNTQNWMNQNVDTASGYMGMASSYMNQYGNQGAGLMTPYNTQQNWMNQYGNQGTGLMNHYNTQNWMNTNIDTASSYMGMGTASSYMNQYGQLLQTDWMNQNKLMMGNTYQNMLHVNMQNIDNINDAVVVEEVIVVE